MPDELFRQAETAAGRLGVSRSELYAKAIAQYLQQLHDNSVTERLNEVYTDRVARVDPRLHGAQIDSLEVENW